MCKNSLHQAPAKDVVIIFITHNLATHFLQRKVEYCPDQIFS